MKPKILKTLWGVPFTSKLLPSLSPTYDGLEVAIDFADFDRINFI
jgi:hypothetical protein